MSFISSNLKSDSELVFRVEEAAAAGRLRGSDLEECIQLFWLERMAKDAFLNGLKRSG